MPTQKTQTRLQQTEEGNSRRMMLHPRRSQKLHLDRHLEHNHQGSQLKKKHAYPVEGQKMKNAEPRYQQHKTCVGDLNFHSNCGLLTDSRKPSWHEKPEWMWHAHLSVAETGGYYTYFVTRIWNVRKELHFLSFLTRCCNQILKYRKYDLKILLQNKQEICRAVKNHKGPYLPQIFILSCKNKAATQKYPYWVTV